MRQRSLISVFATILASVAWAQVGSDPVPLKNWPAPLYWVPTGAEATALDGGGKKQSERSATAASPIGTNALVFVPMTPCRVVDTRPGLGFTGAYGPPSLSAGIARTFPIQTNSTCPFPSPSMDVGAFSFNITVVPHGPLGFLTIWPTGKPRPVVSTLNDLQAQIVANAAIVMAGPNNPYVTGSVDVYASDSTDLIIDINGYYAPLDDGWENSALGLSALWSNTTGTHNTALGNSAMWTNTTGSQNTAVGANAQTGATGSNNTSLGFSAGLLSQGSNNIYIGNEGDAGDNNTIRIGTTGTHTRFIAAGISGVTPGGSLVPVVVNQAGVLGTISSSRRFKEDIADMNDASDGLLRLRPVVFRYKQPYEDGSRPIDYGLVAEEVAQVYPDLVVRDKNGRIETVQYQKLTPMLLNELQREHERGERQADTIRQQTETIRQQADAIRQEAEKTRALEDRVAALEQLLRGR